MAAEKDVLVDRDDNYFDYDDLGVTNAELEKKLAQGITLLKEMARLNGQPTSEFDTELEEPYILFPDGRKEYYGKK